METKDIQPAETGFKGIVKEELKDAVVRPTEFAWKQTKEAFIGTGEVISASIKVLSKSTQELARKLGIRLPENGQPLVKDKIHFAVAGAVLGSAFAATGGFMTYETIRAIEVGGLSVSAVTAGMIAIEFFAGGAFSLGRCLDLAKKGGSPFKDIKISSPSRQTG